VIAWLRSSSKAFTNSLQEVHNILPWVIQKVFLTLTSHSWDEMERHRGEEILHWGVSGEDKEAQSSLGGEKLIFVLGDENSWLVGKMSPMESLRAKRR
jgi:hypothetical protein